MDTRCTLIRMLHQLLREMEVVVAQGAGYYTCAPFTRRYNKLLALTPPLLNGAKPLLDTFEPLPVADPKDPGEKSKVLLELHIEIGQLITLLESCAGEVNA
jgi:hypothetical protein